MIKAFMEVERYGGNVNASILAGGIWEALITTASGLSVAIPLIVFHHFLVSKVNEFSQEMESRTQEVAEVLIEKQEMS
jgi:biopolymer transport protein ExbB